MISTVIIDDEQDCIDDLIYLIKKHSLPFEIVATATSGNDGLVTILKQKPQLVFMDVVMPGMSGFEMLDLLPKLDFKLIVTTSFDKYAVQAIRASAIDFLLKPVKVAELKEATDRIMQKVEPVNKAQINLLHENLKNTSQPVKKIALTISDGIQLVNLDDILYFESDGNYTTVFMKGEKQILVSKPIGRFEEMVDATIFFRIHNSYLINLNCIAKYIKSDGGYVVIENGKSIPVSRSKKDALLEFLGKI